jgi:hypothetical protein
VFIDGVDGGWATEFYFFYGVVGYPNFGVGREALAIEGLMWNQVERAAGVDKDTSPLPSGGRWWSRWPRRHVRVDARAE